jgi:predicted DsbA family dithiol-disulfide isomerase
MVEVFADVVCPFAHVGLRRFVARRAETGREEPVLRVRAWPLELVNDKGFDPAEVAGHVDELRARVAPDLFTGFRRSAVPATSMPALALAAQAYRLGPVVGERVSLAVRWTLFEDGLDVSDPDVLRHIADAHGLSAPDADARADVEADYAEGRRRGVRGSPEFFVDDRSWFCPALHIERVGDGLVVTTDPGRFDSFLEACFSEVVR